MNAKPTTWPPWYHWDVDFTPHLLKRMTDRNFNDIDLLLMLQNAVSYTPDTVIGRYAVQTKHKNKNGK